MGQHLPLFNLFSSIRAENLSSQRDSNSDCWSRRQEPWLLDHHHGPPVFGYSLVWREPCLKVDSVWSELISTSDQFIESQIHFQVRNLPLLLPPILGAGLHDPRRRRRRTPLRSVILPASASGSGESLDGVSGSGRGFLFIQCSQADSSLDDLCL